MNFQQHPTSLCSLHPGLRYALEHWLPAYDPLRVMVRFVCRGFPASKYGLYTHSSKAIAYFESVASTSLTEWIKSLYPHAFARAQPHLQRITVTIEDDYAILLHLVGNSLYNFVYNVCSNGKLDILKQWYYTVNGAREKFDEMLGVADYAYDRKRRAATILCISVASANVELVQWLVETPFSEFSDTVLMLNMKSVYQAYRARLASCPSLLPCLRYLYSLVGPALFSTGTYWEHAWRAWDLPVLEWLSTQPAANIPCTIDFLPVMTETPCIALGTEIDLVDKWIFQRYVPSTQEYAKTRDLMLVKCALRHSWSALLEYLLRKTTGCRRLWELLVRDGSVAQLDAAISNFPLPRKVDFPDSQLVRASVESKISIFPLPPPIMEDITNVHLVCVAVDSKEALSKLRWLHRHRALYNHSIFYLCDKDMELMEYVFSCGYRFDDVFVKWYSHRLMCCKNVLAWLEKHLDNKESSAPSDNPGALLGNQGKEPCSVY